MAKHDNTNPSFLNGIGQKVKDISELVGTVKGIWNVGKAVYAGYQVAAPYLAAAALLVP
jgi:hypothetical protein